MRERSRVQLSAVTAVAYGDITFLFLQMFRNFNRVGTPEMRRVLLTRPGVGRRTNPEFSSCPHESDPRPAVDGRAPVIMDELRVYNNIPHFVFVFLDVTYKGIAIEKSFARFVCAYMYVSIANSFARVGISEFECFRPILIDLAVNLNFNPTTTLDVDPGHALDFKPGATLNFHSGTDLNYGSGPALDFDPGPNLDSVLYLAVCSDSDIGNGYVDETGNKC
ncbi:hypothetical protein EVAR_56036_1 [Eumeta japonica]|uniref:Uncharacterized protein n=1 Tax=Eumeta variegata TaxID=151549 RepID=A0A4C1YMB9_EUMVA|nr:hypothetical protein EVAR_56036_1 [Eumeta japonica]